MLRRYYVLFFIELETSPRPPRWHHDQPDRRLDDPSRPQLLDAAGPGDPVPDPRRRRPVRRRVRRGLPKRRRDDHPHATTRRSRTPTQNAGSAACAASSSTARSSGTADSSNGSYANTSTTTTPTGPTAASANAHPTTREVVSTVPASRSDDTPPAADSSTSTAKQPEPPRQRPTHRQHASFDAPRSPSRTTTAGLKQTRSPRVIEFFGTHTELAFHAQVRSVELAQRAAHVKAR